jgi:hypothetical protein
LLPLVRTLDAPRLLTLTLRSTDTPLSLQLRKLLDSFAKLRRSKLWKAHFSQGLYVIEVTFNKRTSLWHPHVHAVVSGKWVAQSALADAWEKITTDSRVVDIRVAHSQAAACNYLTTYVSKSQDASHVPTTHLADWANALHGKRLVSTFGGLRRILAEDEGPETEPDDRERLIPLAPLWAAAAAGDAHARELLAGIRRATRRRLSDARQAEARDAEAGNRQLVAGLRSWWSEREEKIRGQTSPGLHAPAPLRRPPDRPLRLWKDDDLSPSALIPR